MTTTSDAAWRRDPGLPHQRLEEDTIVVDPRRREVHLLNETATRVWELLASPQSIDQLVSVLADEYDIPSDEVHTAIVETVRDLESKGVLLSA
jgi:hypothetical protein